MLELPQEMRKLDQWIVWRLDKKEFNGQTKEVKVPYNPKIGKSAMVNKAETWGSYNRAMVALEDGDYSGLGFVFTGEDDFIGIDFDYAFDETTGEVKPGVAKWVEYFGSYTEISQSGKGLHIIIRSDRKLETGRNNHNGIEIYSNKRYFAVTGNIFKGYNRIAKMDFQKLLNEEFGISDNSAEREYTNLDDMMVNGVTKGAINDCLVKAVGAVHNRGGSLMEALAIVRTIIEASGMDYNEGFTRKEVERLYRDFDFREASRAYEEEPWIVTTNKGKQRIDAGILAEYLIGKKHIVSFGNQFWIFSEGRLKEVEPAYIERLIIEKIPIGLRSAGLISDIRRQVQALSSMEEYPKLNSNYNLLHFTNGTLNLENFEFRKHLIEDNHLFTTGYAYEADADCPTFRSCMETWYPDEEIRNYIQVLRGYQLLGENRLNIISEFISRGGTGKSTEWNSIQNAYGEYMEIATGDTFKDLEGSNNTPTFDLATFEGKRLIIASEITAGTYCNIEVLKKLTGDAIIKVRPPHQQSRKIKGLMNIEMWVNDHPKTKDLDEAVRRRFKIVPRDCELTEFDINIPRLLETEKAGIMNWILEGLKMYLNGCWKVPESIKKFTVEVLEDNDRVMQFWRNCIVDEPPVEEIPKYGCKEKTIKPRGTKATAIYRAYKEWCRECSYKAIGRTEFYKKLNDCKIYQKCEAKVRYYPDAFLVASDDFESELL